MTHPDGYWLTAGAAAACLLQWLDGSLREPGVHLQALAVDPARLLRDLQRLGAEISGRGVEVAPLLGPPAPDAHRSGRVSVGPRTHHRHCPIALAARGSRMRSESPHAIPAWASARTGGT